MRVPDKTDRPPKADDKIVQVSYEEEKYPFYLPDPNDHIQNLIQRSGFYEVELLENARHFCRSGELAVDVGANIGNHTVFFGAVMGMEVVALEPQDRVYRILQKNVELNGLADRVTLYKAAAGSARGSGRIRNLDPENLGMAQIEETPDGEVEILSLDEMLADRKVALLKIDVEGMELEVLKGALRILQDSAPAVYVEVQDDERRAEVASLLAGLGYWEISSFNWTPTRFFLCGRSDSQKLTVIVASCEMMRRRLRQVRQRQEDQEAMLTKLQRQVDAYLEEIASLQSDFNKRSEVEGSRLVDVKGSLAQVQERLSKRLNGIEADLEGVSSSLPRMRKELGKAIIDSAAQIDDVLGRLRQYESQIQLGRDTILEALRQEGGRSSQEMTQCLESVSEQLRGVEEAVTEIEDWLNFSLKEEGASGGRDVRQRIERIEQHLSAIQEDQRALKQILANPPPAEPAPQPEPAVAPDADFRQEFARRIDYLENQNRWIEERIIKENRRLKEALQAPKSGDSLSARERALSKELRKVKSSASWKAGRALADLRNHPLRGLLSLPVRLLRIARQGRAPKSPSQVAPGGSPAPIQQAARPQQPVPAKERSLPPGGDGTAQVRMVFSDRFKEGWQDWRPNQGVKLEGDGVVAIRQEKSTPGTVKLKVAVDPGRVYRLSFQGRTEVRAQRAYWIVRCRDCDLNLCPVRYFSGTFDQSAPHQILFRTLHHTRSIDLLLVVEQPTSKDRLHLEKITLEEVPDHLAYPRPPLEEGEIITASLASVPSRQDLLRDTVASLLPAVDRLLVFLNGYERPPDFLLREGIEVQRSQDFGDSGDSGKFFWAGRTTEPGYRFTCDDDLIYPPDYVHRMVSKLSQYGNSAVAGVHGIFLKQPLYDYYESSYREVIHFKSRCAGDRAVHILGTGTVAYHSSAIDVSHDQFLFPNMADVWLALEAQRQRVPMVCVKRPRNWLIAREQEAGESIYDHSAERRGSSLDSGLIQTQVLRQNHPFTIQIGEEGEQLGKKLVLGVKTYNRRPYLQDCLNSWLKTRSDRHQWVLIVADDGSTDDTLEFLADFKAGCEMHIIENRRRYAAGQTNTILELCQTISFDTAFVVDDDLIFTQSGWDEAYLHAMERSGYQHLCYLHRAHLQELRDRRGEGSEPLQEHGDASDTCSTPIDVSRCMGAFFTITPAVIEKVGFADEENFPIRGQWHADYSARCCRAGFNDERHFYDLKDSNKFLELQNMIADDYRCSLEWGEEYRKTKEPRELERRQQVIADENRLFIGPPAKSDQTGPPRLESFFDRIYVLNLERRPDRWESVVRQQEHLGLDFRRFPAVDGSTEPYLSQFQAYQKQPLVKLSKHVKPVTNSYEYYIDYESDMARVAYIEQRNGKKAIHTPGAWGYICSMIKILEEALEEDLSSILVLDDDVIFHRDCLELFPQLVAEVPRDWKVLQLGTLQYHWGPEWIEWHSNNLYHCNGSSVGSHAVGIDQSVFPLLLKHCYRFDLPYDEGPLHKIKWLYRKDCFTLFPNLVIQETSDSDIGSSTIQQAEGRREKNVYRWNLSDYGLG